MSDSTIPVTSGSDKPADVVAENSISEDKVTSSEVEALKDTIGGGETLDNEAGVTTRGVEQDAYKQEKEVDGLKIGEDDA